MVAFAYDPYLMFTLQIHLGDKTERAVVCFQADDTLYFGKDTFKDCEEQLSRRFAGRPAKCLQSGGTIASNGHILESSNRNIT